MPNQLNIGDLAYIPQGTMLWKKSGTSIYPKQPTYVVIFGEGENNSLIVNYSGESWFVEAKNVYECEEDIYVGKVG